MVLDQNFRRDMGLRSLMEIFQEINRVRDMVFDLPFNVIIIIKDSGRF